MKKSLLLAIIAILFTGIASADCTRIVKCPICGAEMIEHYECPSGDMAFYGDNIQIYPGTGYFSWSPEIEKMPDAVLLKSKKEILICEDCHEKYAHEIREAVTKAWETTIGKIKSEQVNVEARKTNGVKAKERKLDEMKKDLKDMQNQIDKLQTEETK